MVYLHNKLINNNLIMHWANESESAANETPTYKIRQVESGQLYDSAVDPVTAGRHYEATDIKIETEPEEQGI